MRRIVVDTNVVVSAVLSDGPPHVLVSACLHGLCVPLLDSRVLDEYRRVLPRPRFGKNQEDIDALLAGLVDIAEEYDVPPTRLPFDLPHANDAPFAELAMYAHADAMVTGNLKHFTPLGEHGGIPVLTPAQAVARLDRR